MLNAIKEQQALIQQQQGLLQTQQAQIARLTAQVKIIGASIKRGRKVPQVHSAKSPAPAFHP